MTIDATDDRPARVAIRAELDTTHFVEAGAGTGKTTALVGRIVELVVSGRARMADIAAITFTEAAAGELRDRIAEALERSAAGTYIEEYLDVDPGDVPLRAERARAALAEADGAAVSTLHGFARRILATHPFEAGLPPLIDVLDEVRSTVAFDERWKTFVDELLDSQAHQQAVLVLLTCGVKFQQLRDIALQFNQNWDLVEDAVPGTPTPVPVDPAPMLEPLTRALAMADFCLDGDDKLLAHLEALSPYAAILGNVDNELDTLRAIVDAPPLFRKWGQQGNWGPGRCDEVRGLLEEAQTAKDDLLNRVANAALANLVVSIRELTLRSAADRRREGRLEFHDLLVLARELVRHRPDVCRTLSEQFRFLLIDEFQDTDPIQAELAVRIASDDPDAGQKRWTELTFDPGRVFFVGDPKQSIYRFRRADIALFLGIRDRYSERPLVLSKNRRSVPGIIKWVNAVFGDLMGAGTPGIQPAYEPLVAHRADHAQFGDRPPVLALGEAVVDKVPMSTIREKEAADIASAIRRIIDNQWPVGDSCRAADLADITILVPTRTGLPILTEALDDADVPYRLESSSLVYSAPEVRELMSVLQAVDDPTDEVAIVGALRSALFGCGDDDLLEYRLHHGTWDYRVPAPDDLDDDHPVVAGRRALAAFHAERWWYEVSGLIERIVDERRVLELALTESRPREVWRRLRFVADQARQFTDAFGGDLRRYLAWAELQSDEDARVTEVILPETDHNAVRIMTVHASKGLEFPIVVLSGLNVADRTRSGARVLWGANGPEVFVRKDVRTAGFDALAAGEEAMEAAERVRLLYVAATRARDHLVVCLHHKAANQPNCHAARLEIICSDHPKLWRQLEEEAADGEQPAPPASPAAMAPPAAGTAPSGTVEDTAEERQRWMDRRAEQLASAAVPRTVAATTVARMAAEQAELERDLEWDATEPDDELDVELSPWRQGRTGTELGRAVHATLQLIDLATGDGLTELARAQAAVEGIPGRASEVAGRVAAALRSDIIRTAVESGRCWKELYVGAPVGSRVLEGFIDLLVDGPDGLVVVDYKTDSASTPAELDRALERYSIQGASYAVAIEQALGRPVERCVFLFLRPGGAVERSVVDLEEAKRTVQGLMQG